VLAAFFLVSRSIAVDLQTYHSQLICHLTHGLFGLCLILLDRLVTDLESACTFLDFAAEKSVCHPVIHLAFEHTHCFLPLLAVRETWHPYVQWLMVVYHLVRQVPNDCQLQLGSRLSNASLTWFVGAMALFDDAGPLTAEPGRWSSNSTFFGAMPFGVAESTSDLSCPGKFDCGGLSACELRVGLLAGPVSSRESTGVNVVPVTDEASVF
jgi:hypothetical protein